MLYPSKTKFLLALNSSRFKISKPRASQQVAGRPISCRLTPRRSEHIASSEAPQNSALQETSLSVQTLEEGVDASPLVFIERQAGPLASIQSDPPSSRERRKAKGKPCTTMFPDFQQGAKPKTMGIPTRSVSIESSKQSHRYSKSRFFWREPSPQAPNLLKQPHSYQPDHVSQYESQGWSHDATDLGRSYRPSPMGHICNSGHTTRSAPRFCWP